MSTVDRRRLLGPHTAKPLHFPQAPPSSRSQTKTSNDKIYLKPGFIGNANGSSYIESGDVIISCSVFGPRPIRGVFIDQAVLNIETKILPYGNNNTLSEQDAKPGHSSSLEKLMSSYIETSILPSILLDSYSKSSIDIFISIMSQSKNTMTTIANAINAVSIALIDAAIECQDIVTAGTALIPNDNSTNEIILNPSQEITKNDKEVLASFMCNHNNVITGFWSEGPICDNNGESLDKLINGANEIAKRSRAVIDYSLLEEFKKSQA